MKTIFQVFVLLTLFALCGIMEKQDVDHQEKVSKTPIPEQTVYVGESVAVVWEF